MKKEMCLCLTMVREERIKGILKNKHSSRKSNQQISMTKTLHDLKYQWEGTQLKREREIVEFVEKVETKSVSIFCSRFDDESE